MFNLPNIFTAFNLLSGVTAILLALGGMVEFAPYAIFFGAILDFFDGFLARKLKVAGDLGKQLDSLADVVSFGVAPGVVMFVILTMNVSTWVSDDINFFYDSSFENWQLWLRNIIEGKETNFYPFIAFLIPFFSLFRLAKFNLDTRQTESFIGLPTPANTLFFMSYPLVIGLGKDHLLEHQLIYQWLFDPNIVSLFILLMSLMLVSEIPLFSLKFKAFKWKGNELRFSFLLISLIFILLFKAWSLALIVFLYLILSVIENNILKTKKNEI